MNARQFGVYIRLTYRVGESSRLMSSATAVALTCHELPHGRPSDLPIIPYHARDGNPTIPRGQPETPVPALEVIDLHKPLR